MNKILKQKVSITSRKRQTTRHAILGIKTEGETQTIYVDTPGIHQKEKKEINRYMNRTASRALSDVDVVVFVVAGTKWTDEDEIVASKLQKRQAPLIVVVNKVDLVEQKPDLLEQLKFLTDKLNPTEIIPISAKNGSGVHIVESTIEKLLPESEFFYPEDQITDRTERFQVAEIIREKLMRMLGDELPYAVSIEIEEFKDKKDIINISAIIWIERNAQKAMVIGEKGAMLKQIGTTARKDIETVLEKKVFLRLWVRVKEGWSDDIRALRSLGYTDFE